ncbi:DUF58 domain-containing protein [bacterium]|nr:DUF58 domain-containing protein [bacterium]
MNNRPHSANIDWRSYIDPKRISRIEDLNLVARLVVEGFITGLHRSPYKGFSVEFAEHREYTRGDEPRNIDWKVWSRTDKYYIKEYEEETNLKACLIVDGSGSMQYAQTEETNKLDYARHVAAALGYLMIRQADAVGLAVSGVEKLRYIPPRSSRPHLKTLLKEMVAIPTAPPANTKHKMQSLATVLHTMAERMKRRGLVIILSDLWEEPEDIIKGLHHLNYRRHEVILFHILDTNEHEFPFAGATTFIDAETGEELPTDATLLRRDYLRMLAEWRQTYTKACAQCQIDYVPVNTATPFDRVLVEYLSKRAKLY